MTARRRAAAGVALMLAATFTGAGPAQAQAGTGELLVAVDSLAPPTVTATITPPRALQDRDLPPKAFSVQENGREVPVEVTRLPADTLEVVLVVDTSGSMRGEPLAAAKAAATAFVNRMPAATRIAVVGFGASPVLGTAFTAERDRLRAAIGGLSAAGETAIYDAVAAGVALFSPGARKSIVVLSDGADTVSQITLEDAKARLESAGVRVDAILLGVVGLDAAALDGLAAAGQGVLVRAEDPSALAGLYDAIASRLVSQYRVFLNSSSSGPTALRFTVAADGQVAEAEVTVDLGPAPGRSGAPAGAPPPGVDGRPEMLVGGAAAVLASLVLLGAVGFRPTERAARLARRARLGRPAPVADAGGTALSRLAARASAAADQALEHRGWRPSLNGALERAGVDLRPGEFAVLVLSGVAVAVLAGLALSGLLLGLLFAAAVPVLARSILVVLADRRRRRFGDQLGDVLDLMAGSLRAGYALFQAVDAVAREAESPSAEEFRRLVLEARLGRDLSESLAAMSERVGTEDFDWVVGAVEIHREVGGDLAEVLDNVAATVRERAQLRRQVRVLSAEGRISAYVLGFLPFGLIALLSVVNPGYLQPLTEGAGLAFSGVGAGLMAAGVLWLRRICRLVY